MVAARFTAVLSQHQESQIGSASKAQLPGLLIDRNRAEYGS